LAIHRHGSVAFRKRGDKRFMRHHYILKTFVAFVNQGA